MYSHGLAVIILNVVGGKSGDMEKNYTGECSCQYVDIVFLKAHYYFQVVFSTSLQF